MTITPEIKAVSENREAQQIGKNYSEFVASLVAGQKIELPEKNHPLTRVVQNANLALERQQTNFTLQEMGAVELLRQAFPEDLIPDMNCIELKNPSQGLFIVRVDIDEFKKMRPDARAVAVKVKNGISFVLVPKHKDSVSTKKEDNENIPHEIHHLIWALGNAADLIDSNEIDDKKRRAFLSYMDEVIAKLVSGGSLFGHTKENEFLEDFAYLNDILREIKILLKRTNYQAADLIVPVFESKNISKLKETLLKIKDELEKVAGPAKEVIIDDWSSIVA